MRVRKFLRKFRLKNGEEQVILEKNFWKGYLRICFWGQESERFLNLCAHHKIQIWQIEKHEEVYWGYVLISDFYRIDTIRKKTGIQVKIKGKYGIPFFFYRNKRRKVFFIGFLLAFMVVFLLSGRVWNIHVEGNIHNSTESILSYLETIDVWHGMKRNQVDCGYIAGELRKEFPDITWVSAKLTGARLMLEIKENESYQEEKQLQKKENPCDMRAKKDGIILSMIVRKGIAQKKIGENCSQNEILVSGSVPIINDSQEIVDYYRVQADADIEIKYKMEYYQEFSRTYQKIVSSGETRQGCVIQVGNYYFKTGPNLKTQEYNRFIKLRQLKLTENFKLPVFYGRSLDYAIEKKEKVYTKEEAEKKAEQTISRVLETLSQKGIQISENHVRIEVNKNSCVTKGSLILIEKATCQTPLKTERNNSIDEQYN